MKPHTQITSIKAATPPRSGDRYEHSYYGAVKLISRAGGDLWYCSIPSGKRLILRPALMKRLNED